VRSDVIQLALVEEQTHARRRQGLEHSTEFFRGRACASHRFFDRHDDGAQGLGADGLTDGLLGIEELIDISLRKADRLGQVRDGRLLVTVAAEMLSGRLDDLLSNNVVGRAARLWDGRRSFMHKENDTSHLTH
jgi:hypothetical protein